MKFYIATPTYNSLSWLQCCIRSVADQVADGVEIHHHIQDGGSTDGTVAWLQEWLQQHADIPGYTFTYTSAKDNGMYDALNKAWDAMPETADVAAHLNSDEQYMPGALAELASAFAARPSADALYMTYLVLDEQYRYICHRRPVTPRRLFSNVICELTTCATFLRADFFRKCAVRFDTSYRSLADLIFYRDMMNCSARVHSVPEIVSSIYIVTGANISWSAISDTERARILAALPAPLRMLRPLIVKWHNFKRICIDKRSAAPESYALYHQDDNCRTSHPIRSPKGTWRQRSVGEDVADSE